MRAIASLVDQERGTAEGFAVCLGGPERPPDWAQERDYIRSLAAAGATWWNEWVLLADPERTCAAISHGSLRIE